MTGNTGKMENFWKELRRRKVISVTTVYAATAFIILQLVDIIAEPLSLPKWTLPLIIVILTVGLVISVLLAWIYDITPTGVTKTKPAGSAKAPERKIQPVSAGWKIATIISILVLVILVFYNLFNSSKSTDISKLEKSIAVLPFINDSPSDSNQYFINGIMEEVLNNLQVIKNFRVLSRTSTDQYKTQSRPSIPEIAEKLRVNFIVEGSGQKYGNQFIMRVQLIAAQNERHLWAKSYDRKINGTSDIIGIQSEIAQQIASELKATITPDEKSQIEKTVTSNLTAYDFYQRGRDEHKNFWMDNSNTEALKNAVALYRKALEFDNTFARAYSGLSLAYIDKNSYSASSYYNKSYLDSALMLADTAIYYDNKLAEAYYAKAAYYFFSGQTEKASEQAYKALDYNPNYWEVYSASSMVFLRDNNQLDFVRGISYLEKAISINRGLQLPYLLRDLSMAYGWIAGFTDEAKQYSVEALSLDRDSASYFNILAKTEWLKGNFIDAANYYTKCLRLHPDNMENLYLIGECFILSGDKTQSLEYFKRYLDYLKSTGQIRPGGLNRIGFVFLENNFKIEAEALFAEQQKQCEESIKMKRVYASSLNAYYDLAANYAIKGEKKKAYDNLRIWSDVKAFPFWCVVLIKNDPLFDSLRNEHEFQDIMKEVGDKYQAEHERMKKWIEEKGSNFQLN